MSVVMVQSTNASKHCGTGVLSMHGRMQPTIVRFTRQYVCVCGRHARALACLHMLVGAGDIGSSGSLEYLVYFNALEGVAAKYGLRLVTDYGDPALNAMFERVSM